MKYVDDEMRLGDAGICACGSKIVRGFDDTGELVTVNTRYVDAATELLAHIDGRLSFVMTYQQRRPRGLVLWRRTRLDIRRRPARFNNRTTVVIQHDCADRQGKR